MAFSPSKFQLPAILRACNVHNSRFISTHQSVASERVCWCAHAGASSCALVTARGSRLASDCNNIIDVRGDRAGAF
eukprot:6182541-Pleurochrysis_carterae.AAC.2